MKRVLASGDAARRPRPFGQPVMYVQPVVDLATGRVVAAEALARFPESPQLPIGSVFARAHEVAGGVELEARCVRAGRDLLPGLPAGIDLAVNVSPNAVDHPLVQEALHGDLTGIVVEVTEQPAADPRRLARALAEIKGRGARVAVDDVTTGHAGLMRLAELRPDIIKIDRRAVVGIRDRTEQVAVVEALVSMGRRLQCAVLAEGVESLEDVPTLAHLGVDLVQGWAIAAAEPTLQPVPDAVRRACLDARRDLLSLEPAPPTSDRNIEIHHVTADLARAAHRVELDRALISAAYTLDMDMITVSALSPEGTLRELIATGSAIDSTPYRLADYPATAAAMRDGVMLEVHIGDPEVDPQERAVLERLGFASLLLVPLSMDGRPHGVLEFYRKSERAWSARDIDDARVLGRHVAQALDRLAEQI